MYITTKQNEEEEKKGVLYALFDIDAKDLFYKIVKE
jgi:hypothetical protein